jgi:hypothetical protein
MLAVIGAFFLVGLATVIISSVQNCGTIAVIQVLKYGSIWALFPALVFFVTQDKYITALSVWIPTFVIVNQMMSICSKPALPPVKPAQPAEEECVDE